MSSRSVGVQLQGRDYQIRSDGDAEWLRKVAGYVDKAMNQVREHTNTVDTLDVALLTSLNLAREVIDSRGSSDETEGGGQAPDAARVKSLIELVEGTINLDLDRIGSPRSGENDTPLLTLPTGDELDGLEGDLLDPKGLGSSTRGAGSKKGGGN